jgi:hypothetical protein
VLSISVGATIMIVIVQYVSSHNNDQTAGANNPAALAAANQEGAIIVRQDQTPHVARLRPGHRPAAALDGVVRAYVASLISRGIVDGPLKRSACIRLAPHRGRTTLPFRCAVIAGGLGYPFLAVVDVRARKITYCKVDAPPVPSDNIPVSRRCTG